MVRKAELFYAVVEEDDRLNLKEFKLIGRSPTAYCLVTTDSVITSSSGIKILVKREDLKHPRFGQLYLTKQEAVKEAVALAKSKADEAQRQLSFWRDKSKLSRKKMIEWMRSDQDRNPHEVPDGQSVQQERPNLLERPADTTAGEVPGLLRTTDGSSASGGQPDVAVPPDRSPALNS